MLAAPNRRAIVAGYGSPRWSGLVTCALLTAVALIAGMKRRRRRHRPVRPVSASALLVNIAATFWAAGVALRLRSIQAGPLMQTPVFLILFLAPVYVPLRC